MLTLFSKYRPRHILKMNFPFVFALFMHTHARAVDEIIPQSIITGHVILSGEFLFCLFHVQKMKCQKKLFSGVSSRDLHWENKTYQYPPIKNNNVISKGRYTPIRSSHGATYNDPQPFGTKVCHGGTAVKLSRFRYKYSP